MQFPDELKAFIGSNYTLSKAAHGDVHGAYFIEAEAGSFVLKISAKEDANVIHQEFQILKALAKHQPLVARAVLKDSDEEKDYFLFSRLAGQNLAYYNSADLSTKRNLVIAYAEMLRDIHGWQPDLDKPYLSVKLMIKQIMEQARQAYRIKSIGQFNGSMSNEVFDFAKEHLENLEDEFVFSHGDICLPNVLMQGGHVTGLVDWGDAGYMDKRFDLATAIMSLRYNFKDEGLTKLFLETYAYPLETKLLDAFEALYVLT